jgi:predicted membrane protein
VDGPPSDTRRGWPVWPTLAAAAAGLALLSLAARFAYVVLFTQFAAYDDEGYVMETTRAYLAGHRLYDEVFTQYGPAFYLLQRAIFGLAGFPLTHDVVRLATLVAWLGTALAIAWLVQRACGSFLFAAIAFVPVMLHLVPLVNEPGHPQAVLTLAIVLTGLSLAGGRGGSGSVRLGIAGALTAFCLLTKINVGVYLLIGCAIALLIECGPRRFFWLLAAAACVLPFLVFRRHLGETLPLHYALLVASSTAAAVIAIHGSSDSIEENGKSIRVYALSVGAASVLFILPVLGHGTSVGGLIEGIALQPARFADIFFMQAYVPLSAAVTSAVSLVLAIALNSNRARQARGADIVELVLKTAFGLAALYAARSGGVTLLGYVVPFSWVVAFRSASSPPPHSQIARRVLAAVSVLQALQAYPVPGTQLALATLFTLPVAVISLHDAAAIVARRLAALPVTGPVVTAIAIACAIGVYGVGFEPETLRHWEGVYRSTSSVRLSGADRLRLPAAETARYQWLAGTTAATCRSLVTMPGFYSLHAWSGISPPTTRSATAWMTLLPAADQQQLWKTLDGSDAPCAVVNPDVAAIFLAGRPLESLPAYQELARRFRTVAEVDGYRFMLPVDDPRSTTLVLRLFAGRQSFARDRAPLPIAATLVLDTADVTLRAWIRTQRSGVVLGCQSTAQLDAVHAAAAPMLYVGRSGRLYGLFPSEQREAQASAQPINDGGWHHVALVRHDGTQSLFVDGVMAGSITARLGDSGLRFCQAGVGLTTGWPDASSGWMAFTGEIEGLGIARAPWSAADVARDLASGPPSS